MADGISRVAMVSMHTSPAAQPGAGVAGGLNVAVLGVAAELALRGVQVDLLTRATKTPGVTRLLPDVYLHELESGDPDLPPDELALVADDFGEAVAVLARERRYDAIHAHFWLGGLAALPVSLELGVPFVQSFHTLAVLQRDDDERRRRSEMFLAAQADAIIAASSAEAALLIDRVGARAEKTWIVPPGVDLGLFAPRSPVQRAAIRRRLGLELGRPLVVVAGRIEPRKDQELAIRALAELHQLRGWAPVLVVAGEAGDSAYLDELKLLAARSGVAAEVRFAGALHREALADLFGAADVTLVPSTSETFGLVALESAAAGTPVLAAEAGGLAEAVGEGGVLLRDRDPRSWGLELAQLLEHDDRRAALGRWGREHAQRYTWAAAATSLLGVYAGATAARTPPAA
jgi:D-inositol-3-phosphate glycosyltransferase